MERMLITGASGFLGRRAAAFFGPQYQVLTPAHRELDVTDGASVARYMREHRPDYVLHCAAISDTGRCQREPELAQEVNVDSCVHLAKAAAETGSRCLFCSSDQVYFGSRELWAHREDEVLSPANEYGWGKLEAERRVLEVNSDSVLLRLSWMYDSVSLSPTEHGDFLRTLLAHLDRNEPISLPIYDRRGITPVNEVVRNLERTLSLPGGVWNFGADNRFPTYDLLVRVFHRLGLNTGLLLPNEEAFADAPRNLCMDPRRAEQRGVFFSHTEDALVQSIYPFYHK